MGRPTEGDVHVVTGAFGYSGSRIARELLERGSDVRTLTGHPDRDHPLRTRVDAYPFDFERPDRMASALGDARVLYNTFWIRFERGDRTFDWAVRCSRRLFEAAARAGVGRVVHVSILNPHPGSPYAYFRGKARVEAALREIGVAHSILRPALLFGRGDVLVNNLAWIARRSPVLPVPGDGEYRVRPIHVDDLASLACEEGEREEATRVVPAVGPERPSFRGMVRMIGRTVGDGVRVVSVGPRTMRLLAWLLGRLTGDVVLTREEIMALRDGLLDLDGPATGSRALSSWLGESGHRVGRRWASELARHYG